LVQTQQVQFFVHVATQGINNVQILLVVVGKVQDEFAVLIVIGVAFGRVSGERRMYSHDFEEVVVVAFIQATDFYVW